MPLTKDALKRRIDQALGREPADLVIRNARVLDIVSGEIEDGDVAIADDMIVGVFDGYEGKVTLDGRGAVVVPGFIDTHVHVESPCVTPSELDRCALPRGTTTAICDPHEIVNVLGTARLDYFLDCAGHTVMDLKVQLSSCVPSTALETSGARVTATDLVGYRGHPANIGLAEFISFDDIFAHSDDALDIFGIDPDVGDTADRNAAIPHRARHRQPGDRTFEVDNVLLGFLLELDAGEPDDEGEPGGDQPEDEGTDQDVTRASFHCSD
jgi:adenine deaminase